MSNRFGPSNRDRSPPRYDRRPSGNTYPGGGSSYRGSGDSSQPPPDRGPPLGPKADTFSGPGRFPYSPVGRGRGGGPFSNRSSATWDRDQDRDRDRDTRASQPYRSRDDDRPPFARRDRDLISGERVAPVVRDSRPYGVRDRSASPVRARRDSHDSIPPLSSRPSETGSYYGASARGGLSRGRGRGGDWERGRGRNSFGGDRDRDLFSNRSRSRERWRDPREFDRGRASINEDRYERRDHERSREREPRRDYDSWQRDHSPGRASTGAPAGRGASPAAVSTTASHYAPGDRPSKIEYDLGRRASAVVTPGSGGRDRRDNDQTDYFGRIDTARRDGASGSYQTQPAHALSATAGLDYGPPPPSLPTPSAVTGDRTTSNKAPSTKSEIQSSSTTSFQPPLGPKAERAPPVGSSYQAPKPVIQQETPTRTESISRPRYLGVPPSALGFAEGSSKSIDSKPEVKPPMPLTPDKAMPANVPLGPRASLGVGYKPRQPSSEPAPSAAMSLKPTPPSEPRNVPIPKGPRFGQDQWSTAGISNRMTWVSPEYNRSKPSIMNPLGRDRPSFAPPAGPRSQTILPPQNEKPRIFPVSSARAGSLSSSGLGSKPSLSPAQAFSRTTRVATSEDVDMSMPASSEDEDEFDEDDFAASEEKHRQERIMLEAKKPPPLLQDTSIRNLLIRIQFLNMIMHEVVPKSLDGPSVADEKTKVAESSSLGLPSPEELSEEQEEKPELKHPQPRGRPLSQPAINPIPTPPIDDLPFLVRGSPRRLVFDESDDEVEHEAITTLIRQEFESEAFDWQDELQEMHTEYNSKFPMWRQDIAILEQERRELHPSPAPASPAPSVAPSVTPSLQHERTRGARNTTEADLEKAILMSQQSAKEEEERREREAASNSQPNYETEAVVPPMLKPSDEELSFFEDTNKLIPVELAVDVFAYMPPEDDFTEEEQLAFISAYCQYPKKWSKISEAVPGRSYKDCITHYYLTKNEAKYKVIWRNSQPKRKRGRAATKPRSTALLSELVYDNDGDAAVAVTDTGRPRRAAAPTFGDTPGDSDIATPVPPSKRLALNKEPNGETVVAKVGRGRKAGGVTKTRRTKAQMQADQQAANLLPAGVTDGSPQKPPIVARERARTLLRADDGSMRPEMTASPDMPRMMDVEMAQYPLTDADRLPLSNAHAASNQPTSYWSVPEQQKFPQLIAYFGRDFGSIADFMKTKTLTMIKNHYNRQVQDGKSDLEDYARDAEQRRAAGESMGNPPSPAAPTKRRYEATPSTASGTRPLQQDHGIAEVEQPGLAPKSGYTDDFPSNYVQRGTSGIDIIKARPPRDILRDAQPVAPGQAKVEEVQRPSMFGSKPFSGPRSGFFKEEPHSFGLSHQQSPHQHPLRPNEPRITDLNLPQSLLGHSREPLGGPAQNTAQQSSPHGLQALDRLSAPGQQAQHGRSGSLGMVSQHPSLQEARDLSSLRRLESNQRQSPYSLAPSHTPMSMPGQSSMLRPESTMANPSEVPKPAPAKRSNLMNLLNDDPPEPQPQKQSSQDSQKRSSLLSPQPIPVTSQSLSFEAARAQARSEELQGLHHRGMRGGLGQPPPSQLGGISIRDSQAGGPGAQADQNNERWMDRFDPRPQSGPTEQRGIHSSPRVGGYSVVPPSNNQQSARMEAQRSMESGQADHRRMFGQMNHPGSNPSPPPQQAPQSMQPYRSLSGFSHHRFGSTGFQQNQSMSQPSPHMHPTQQPPGPSSHPTSAGTTPVSSLHHQNRPSQDFHPQRLTIQQLKAQQQHQHVHPHQHREREHEEQQLRMQREREMQQQAMRMPERERDHLGRPRAGDFSFGTSAPSQHEQQQQQQSQHAHHQSSHVHNQHPQIMQGLPGARHLGFGAHHQHEQRHEPVSRTFTPPGAPFSAGPEPGPRVTHGAILRHSAGPGPQHGHHGQQQQQQQHVIHPQMQQQPQGPSPGPHQQQQGSQHQQQGQQGQDPNQGQPRSMFGGFGHGHGHFRGMSQGQPGGAEGRDERR